MKKIGVIPLNVNWSALIVTNNFDCDFHNEIPGLKCLGDKFVILLWTLEDQVKTWILDSINDFHDGV